MGLTLCHVGVDGWAIYIITTLSFFFEHPLVCFISAQVASRGSVWVNCKYWAELLLVNQLPSVYHLPQQNCFQQLQYAFTPRLAIVFVVVKNSRYYAPCEHFNYGLFGTESGKASVNSGNNVAYTKKHVTLCKCQCQWKERT